MKILENIQPTVVQPPSTYHILEVSEAEMKELLQALLDDRGGAASPVRQAMYDQLHTALAGK